MNVPVRRIRRVVAGMAVASLALAGAGCETQSGDQAVVITPKSATLAVNESLSFEATGGFNYSWSLADETLGSLSTRTGPVTVYTSLRDVSNAVQVLTVTSSLTSDVTTGATVTVSAEALINTTVAPGRNPVAVSPSSVTVTVGTTNAQTFTASGGNAPYTWSVSDDARGWLQVIGSSDGTTAQYTRTAAVAGSNEIVARDSNGRRATAATSEP